MAAGHMVVHESHGLHERVGGDRTDEPEAVSLERFRESATVRGLGGKIIDGRRTLLSRVCSGRERPDERRKVIKIVELLDDGASVPANRIDLAPMSNDARTFEHREPIFFGPSGERSRFETVECDSKIGASTEDRDPTESRLHSLETELLEQRSAVTLGNSPFLVVITAIEGVGAAPRASRRILRRTQRKSPCRQLVAVVRSRAATTTGVDAGSKVWIASMTASAGSTPSPRGMGAIDLPSSSS